MEMHAIGVAYEWSLGNVHPQWDDGVTVGARGTFVVVSSDWVFTPVDSAGGFSVVSNREFTLCILSGNSFDDCLTGLLGDDRWGRYAARTAARYIMDLGICSGECVLGELFGREPTETVKKLHKQVIDNAAERIMKDQAERWLIRGAAGAYVFRQTANTIYGVVTCTGECDVQ
jgi:hypothetical protein